ncbi:MAG: DNA polymerase I [Proteobacteria bacterium]|nr:DNA polymerase I [Pseudomonadota bacterium]
MADRVVLVDGSSLIYRAFFAIPQNFSTAAGLPTNAIYGFALMFRKVLAGKRPKYGAVVFDAPGPTFRDEKYPAYKAQRPRMDPSLRLQIPWIHKVVEAHDFPLLSVPGFEADDVIGTLTTQARAAGHEVQIIAGDKDFAQLIGEGVRMIDTMRDITFDEEVVRKKWGVRPGQFVDFLALVGDKVDNIPGVPGVGVKGAATLLEKYGDLEGVLAAVSEMRGKRRENLENFAAQARMSQELATIECAVPLERSVEQLLLVPVDEARVNALFGELEFHSLLSATAQQDLPKDASAKDWSEASDASSLRAFLAEAGPTAAQVLWDEPNATNGSYAGIAVARAGDRARYVRANAAPDVQEVLREHLADAQRPKVFHDVRSARAALTRAGFELRGVVGDTGLASFLIDPTKLIPHRLGQISKAFLRRVLPDEKAVLGSGKKRLTWAEADPERVAVYGCTLAQAVFDAWEPVRTKLEDEGATDLLGTLGLPLAEVLADMQVAGIRVDAGHLLKLQAEFAGRKVEVEEEIHGLAGRSFNIGSTKQLSAVLFDELGLPVIKKTKTGFSTASDVLERLAPNHPIAGKVLAWRALAKLINTYTEVLVSAVREDTGRVHCTFMQTTGASGRLITTDPDLQRTPIRTGDGRRIREAFIPRDGWRLISADWSQIELRILAHMSRDPELCAAFREGVDVHRRTASRIYDVDVDAVSPEQRNVGKTVNFATIYGQGATALGQSLGMPRKQAAALIERYFERYSGVRDWRDAMIVRAHESGFVTTYLGRKRFIPELTVSGFSQRAYGERVAANTPIQGSAADICKLAMLAIAEELNARGLKAKMLLQIHDELLFEAPPDEVDAVVELVRKHMQTVVELEVPLVVDIGVGASWAEAH